MHDRIHNIITDVTEGLKDDPELRLDVQAELASHLEETARACAADGMGEDEAAEQAIKSFGAPLDVAGALLEANKGRMKLRALARLAVKAVLVPLAVLVAVWIAMDITRPILAVQWMNNPFHVNSEGRITEYPVPFRLAEEKRGQEKAFRFLLYGDLSRKTLAQQQRAIWERHPENKSYFANYAIYAVQPGNRKSPLPSFEREMRLGCQVDPDNALYDYLLAFRLFHAAAELEAHEIPTTPEKGPQYDFTLKVKDRRLLDRAMEALCEGASKPYCATYGEDLYRERSAYISTPTRLSDGFARIYIEYQRPLCPPEVISWLVRGLPLYAQQLMDEGKREEARRCLDAWQPFCTHWGDGADYLVSCLVLHTQTKYTGSKVAALYGELGDHTRALQVRRLVALCEGQQEKRLREMHDNWGPHQKQMGFFASLMLPRIANISFTADELIASRKLEYTVLEEGLVALLILALLYLMARTYLVSLRWFAGLRGASAAPLLMLPPLAEVARIVALGIVIPLGLYAAYLAVPLLSGRAFGLNEVERLARLLIEFTLALLVLIHLPARVAKGWIRRRCRMMAVPVPAEKPRPTVKRIILRIVIGAVGVMVLRILLIAFMRIDRAVQPDLLAVLGWSVAAGAVLWLALPLRVRPSEYGLYYGSLARTLVPVYALAIMLIGGLVYPALVRQESRLVQQETLIFPAPHSSGVPTVEDRFVQQMKADFRALFTPDGPMPRNE